MTAKLDYRWHLREIMATRGIFSTTGLRPLLTERGIDLSPSQIYRLVVEKPERLSLKTLMALMDILDCRMDELIEPVAATAQRRRKVASAAASADAASTGESRFGQFRPKRARITADQQ
jgi:DNA-binding Xre family transcriptional regulator